MALNPSTQDKRGILLVNFDGSYSSAYPNGDKPQNPVDPNGLVVGADGSGTDDPSSGSVGTPYNKLSYALTQAIAGDVIYLREGTHTGDADINIASLNGITIERYPTDTGQTILDQINTYDGIQITSTNVTIRNIEVHNCLGEHGVSFEDTCDNGLAENVVVNGVNNPTSNSNAGAFYLGKTPSSVAETVTLRNCRGTGVTIAGVSNGNASAIHSYGAQNCTVENFTGHNTYNGIFWKNSTGVGNNIITKCLFYDLEVGVRSAADAGVNNHINTVLRESIFYDINLNAVDTDLDGTGGANTGFEISNCVFDAPLQYGVKLENLTNPQIFNNIFFNVVSPDWSIDSRSTTTLATNDIDVNCYFNAQRFRQDFTNYTTLAAWQSAQDQDNNSNILDPQFVDAPNRDYTVQNASLLGTGVGGANFGAKKTGSETIGATV